MAARVTLRQSFRNDGQSWVEGLYVFPLPEQSAVDRMRLYIGERYIEGEIREKEQAKKEYEAAKQAGKKASLVKQERANLFTTAVANIAPGEEVTVEIEYQQPVDYRDNLFSLRFPLTMTPRYIPGVPGGDRKGSGWAADTSEVPDASLITPPVVTHATDHRVTLSATINAGMPLDLVASRYHPVTVDETGGQYTLALAGQDVPMDHDLELIWRPHPASAPRALVFSEMHEGQPHLLVMLMPPDDAAAPALAMPRELIFVVDTSGSMHGTSIAQARQALLLALDGLQPSDRFNVIQFNSTTHALFTRSMDASGLHMQQARSYVKGLQANGGTEMRPALEAALRSDFDDNYLRQVIFVTDGSVGNEEALFALIDAELGAARLFTVGIGSAPNGWFMQKAAEAGRGTYTFISALHEVNDRMQGLFRKLERPQLTDINVEWPAGISVDAYPETVPDLYAGEPVLLRARLQRPPGPDDVLLISGDAAVSRWSAAIALQADTESAGIATLWARSRIAELENRRRRGADEDTIRKQIIVTALQHHLVSRFTSLVAVDKTPVRPDAESLDREQVASLLPHGQSQQAILGFAATATGAPQQRLVGMLCLLLALTVYLTGRRRAWRPV
jgi:Ca-activated chloride channel family protein